MNKILLDMLQTDSVSGSEAEFAQLIEKEAQPYCEKAETDSMGNLFIYKKGKDSTKKVMVMAEMDEKGFIVTFIDDKGFVRVAGLGAADLSEAAGPVHFGSVPGLILADKDKKEDLKITDMFIDIGAATKKEAEALLQIGDTGCMTVSQTVIGSKVAGKALSSKAACFAALSAIKELKAPQHDCVFVFAAQGNLSHRGAVTAANREKADSCIVAGACKSSDSPAGKTGIIKCGGGPAVKISDASAVCSPIMTGHITKCAKTAKIELQIEAANPEGSCAGPVHIANKGVVTGGISIPVRYMGGRNELCDLHDINEAARLLVSCLETEIADD